MSYAKHLVPVAAVFCLLFAGCVGHSIPEMDPPGGAALPNSVSFGHGAATLTTLYDFPNVQHGQNPQSPFTLLPDGTLVGTANSGGTGPNAAGVAFELVPSNGSYKENVVYQFTTSGTAGPNPGPLSADGSGNYWGISRSGIFVLEPAKTAWNAKLVYSCSTSNGHSTSDTRVLIQRNLVFASCLLNSRVMVISHSGGSYLVRTAYQFPRYSFPNGGLVSDSKGNVFGTASNRGQGCCAVGGPVFELSPSGGTYAEHHLFSAPTFYGPLLLRDGVMFIDGFYPGAFGYAQILRGVPSGGDYRSEEIYGGVRNGIGTPVQDASGNLYYDDGNAVIQLVRAGNSHVARPIYTFTVGNANQMTIDAQGTLYGATTAGGGTGCGGTGCGYYFKLKP